MKSIMNPQKPVWPNADKYLLITFLVACGAAATVLLASENVDTAVPVGLSLIGLVAVNIIIYWLVAKKRGAEDKLRKNEELFRLVLNGINDGVFDYKINEGTIYYSPAYHNILGYDENEMGSTHDVFSSLLHPDDLVPATQYYEDYIRRRIPTYFNTFRLRHKDGHYVWLQSRGIGIWDDKGRILRLVGTHTDVTEQKEREEKVFKLMRENDRQREELTLARDRAEAASQAKTEFLATMSHEIRTPMNAVIGLSRIMMTTALNAKQQEMMKTLQSNADILLHLVNDLLDLNRIEAAQVELEVRNFAFASIFETLRAMFQHQASNKGLAFTIHNRLGEKSFKGDLMRIQQILVNLIGNALKFTSEGGITITADGVPMADGRNQVHITVADTGVGIANEKLGSIFEKFVQADQTISRRFGGSGLGLAICKSLAELMGGDITVTSRPGEGSTFLLSIPLQAGENEQPASIAPVEEKAAIPHRRTALVVEDYPANILVTTLMLEDLGYSAEVAKSGLEAIEKIAVRSKPYDVILMDVQMPEMDGLEATRRIRSLEKEKGFQHFIIGVTANAMAGDRERCIAAGMDEYIAKPVHPDVLEKKLAHISKAA